jgi:hypothetical protein
VKVTAWAKVRGEWERQGKPVPLAALRKAFNERHAPTKRKRARKPNPVDFMSLLSKAVDKDDVETIFEHGRKLSPAAMIATIIRKLSGTKKSKLEKGDVEKAMKSLRVRNPETAKAKFERLHWGKRAGKVTRGDAPDPKGELVSLGKLKSVVYECRKGRGKLTEYEHDFKAPFATLAVNPENKLVIVGGGYTVKTEGIVG